MKPACNWLLAAIAAATLHAAAREPGAAIATDLPARPTEVEAAIYVVDIVAIDGANQVFTADVVAGFRWREPAAGSARRRQPPPFAR